MQHRSLVLCLYLKCNTHRWVQLVPWTSTVDETYADCAWYGWNDGIASCPCFSVFKITLFTILAELDRHVQKTPGLVSMHHLWFNSSWTSYELHIDEPSLRIVLLYRWQKWCGYCFPWHEWFKLSACYQIYACQTRILLSRGKLPQLTAIASTRWCITHILDHTVSWLSYTDEWQ